MKRIFKEMEKIKKDYPFIIYLSGSYDILSIKNLIKNFNIDDKNYLIMFDFERNSDVVMFKCEEECLIFKMAFNKKGES